MRLMPIYALFALFCWPLCYSQSSFPPSSGGGASYTGCTSDSANGITCSGKFTSGNAGGAAGQLQLIDASAGGSGATTTIQIPHLGTASSLNAPNGVTGQLGCAIGTLTPGHLLAVDSSSQCYIDGGATASAPGMVQLGQCVIGTGCTGTVTGAQSATAVSFGASGTTIPGTYTDLVITYIGRSTVAAGTAALCITLNGDTNTAANYSTGQNEAVLGTGSPGTAFIAATGTCGSTFGTFLTNLPGASGTHVSFPGTGHTDVNGYANTTFFKRINTVAAYAQATNVDDVVLQTTGTWKSTVAITSVGLNLAGNSFVSGSTLTLYARQ